MIIDREGRQFVKYTACIWSIHMVGYSCHCRRSLMDHPAFVRPTEFSKAKSTSVLLTADGFGGLKPVQDHRFDDAEWPITFDVPKERADTWLLYLSAESHRRGWTCQCFGQISGVQNQGSITITC